MSEHTPGPWQLGHLLIDPNLHLSVHERAGWTIANCNFTVRPTAENEANARLIAAAPELLEACEAFVSAAEIWFCDTPEVDSAYKAARAAIAKARGPA